MREQSLFPIATDVILDVIPVDMVASAVLAVTAQALVEEPELVFQVSSGDTNPSKLGRLVDLLGLFKREHFRGKAGGNRFLNEVAARMEAQAVKPESFEKYSLPILHKATKKRGDRFAPEQNPADSAQSGMKTAEFWPEMARPAGLEPATPGLEDRCSIPLSLRALFGSF